MSVDVSLAQLLAPGRIGPLALPNRMVMAPMGTGLATSDGFVTERLIAYYAARAQGGVGLIITEASGVDFPTSMGRLNQPRSHTDQYIPGLSRLVEAIHEGGARAAAQIFHAGRVSPSRQVGVQPVGPSAIAAPIGEIPRELSRPEIAAIVDRFADAARRMRAAGFDGIEIHGAHGYLITNFLSAAANRREDEYGGDLAGRARFLIEVIRAVRAAVPSDMAVWVRLNAEEPGLADGITIEETATVCAMAAAAGADAVHVSAFGFQQNALLGAMPQEPGLLLPLAARLKQEAGLPVIAVGRIDPVIGNAAIASGQTDFVALGRALIADPALPRKAAAGALDDIRPCLACLKCLDGLQLGGVLACSVNPALGREADGPPVAATRSRKVVVVGGGPAGMETARVAALRGHRVVLYEQSPTLGGQLIPGATPPGKADIAIFNRHLAGQLSKVGVTTKLGQPATASVVAAEQPDAVVLATGTVPLSPELPGIDAQNVVTALEVLAGRVTVGERVVVIGGELVACETAEFLATAGKTVTILRRGPALAARINRTPRLALLHRLDELGVRTFTGVHYEAITPQGVSIISADGVRETIPADTVVLATGGKPWLPLADELAVKVPETHAAGDCADPRSIMEAIADGYRVGLQL